MPAATSHLLTFSQTPNFAMDTSDVGLPVNNANSTPAKSRITLQYFLDDYEAHVGSLHVHHNSDARFPPSHDSPPSVLFDYTYGCAVLQKWRLSESKDYIWQATKDIFYDDFNSDNEDEDDINNNADDGGDRSRSIPVIRRKGSGGVSAVHVEETQRATGESHIRENIDVRDLVFASWMYNAKKARRQARLQRTMKTDSPRGTDPDLSQKIECWLKSTE
ncbi:hypothetical protein H2248_008062 [Termitomyces sp. 'cryptogamus']|nr:hypothetical protein H2248_008062 [Termitomyces sp. 'cryptogamus']